MSSSNGSTASTESTDRAAASPKSVVFNNYQQLKKSPKAIALYLDDVSLVVVQSRITVGDAREQEKKARETGDYERSSYWMDFISNHISTSGFNKPGKSHSLNKLCSAPLLTGVLANMITGRLPRGFNSIRDVEKAVKTAREKMSMKFGDNLTPPPFETDDEGSGPDLIMVTKDGVTRLQVSATPGMKSVPAPLQILAREVDVNIVPRCGQKRQFFYCPAYVLAWFLSSPTSGGVLEIIITHQGGTAPSIECFVSGECQVRENGAARPYSQYDYVLVSSTAAASGRETKDLKYAGDWHALMTKTVHVSCNGDAESFSITCFRGSNGDWMIPLDSVDAAFALNGIPSHGLLRDILSCRLFYEIMNEGVAASIPTTPSEESLCEVMAPTSSGKKRKKSSEERSNKKSKKRRAALSEGVTGSSTATAPSSNALDVNEFVDVFAFDGGTNSSVPQLPAQHHQVGELAAGALGPSMQLPPCFNQDAFIIFLRGV